MIAKIVPDVSQIEWHVNAAIANLSTLKSDPETMIEVTRNELETLLKYLREADAANQLVVFFKEGDKSGIGVKGFVGECDVLE